jgi:hypothetical protein
MSYTYREKDSLGLQGKVVSSIENRGPYGMLYDVSI